MSKIEYASTFENLIILQLLFRNLEMWLAVTEKKINHIFKNERPKISFSLNYFVSYTDKVDDK